MSLKIGDVMERLAPSKSVPPPVLSVTAITQKPLRQELHFFAHWLVSLYSSLELTRFSAILNIKINYFLAISQFIFKRSTQDKGQSDLTITFILADFLRCSLLQLLTEQEALCVF